MGLTDVFNSVIDKARRNCPDVATPVSKACQSSYDLGRAAVNGSQKLKDYIPGPENRQKIGAHALNIVDSPLGKEALKFIPGGGLVHETYKWWSQSDQDDKKTKGLKNAGSTQKVGEDAHLKYEKRVLHEHPRRSGGSPKALDPAASVKVEKPEVVLSDFIQNGFMGRAFLDALLVPNLRTVKIHQQEGIPKAY